MRLYHATAIENVATISAEGLQPGTCLTGSTEQADYYAETIEDEGRKPVILELELADLLKAIGSENLEPDYEALAEPITSTIEFSEEDVHEAWAESSQTWRDSLDIVGSFVVRTPVPANIICFEDYDLALGSSAPSI